MLSKEEIEKAKVILEDLSLIYEQQSILIPEYKDSYISDKEAIETLLEYIEELEKSDTSKEKSSMNYYNKYKELKQENKKLNKMIDEMAEQLAGIAIWNIEKDEPIILGDKEEVKQYFEKKVEKDNVKN